MNDRTDEKLVRLAQNGDTTAFEELVARHQARLYARTFSMMRNEREATALSRRAWMEGERRLGQFQGESMFITWMTRIVIRLCLDRLRGLKRASAWDSTPIDNGGFPV